jgi:addiction module HigA family antidote
MAPMSLTRYRLANEFGVPAPGIGGMVRGKRSVTADIDLRLCRFFGLCDGYGLRAQVAYDIEVARRERAPELARVRPWAGTAA